MDRFPERRFSEALAAVGVKRCFYRSIRGGAHGCSFIRSFHRCTTSGKLCSIAASDSVHDPSWPSIQPTHSLLMRRQWLPSSAATLGSRLLSFVMADAPNRLRSLAVLTPSTGWGPLFSLSNSNATPTPRSPHWREGLGPRRLSRNPPRQHTRNCRPGTAPCVSHQRAPHATASGTA